MNFIANAFSVNMLQTSDTTVRFTDIEDVEEAAQFALTAKSVVGHDTTAIIFSTILGVDVPCNRATVSLRPGDAVLLGQYSGARLDPNTTTLPEGAKIRWVKVRILEGV